MDTSDDERHDSGISPQIHNTKSVRYLSKRTNFHDPLFDVITNHYYFQRYAKKTLRPDYKSLSREFLTEKVIERYNESKDYVKRVLADAICKVNVSIDVWSSFNGEFRYVFMICHFVRDDWFVSSFVIGFEVLDKFEYGCIAGKVIEVLDKFGLKEKVGSISFEDSVSKEKCMEYLGKEFDFKVLEMFALDRSFANVVDLCGNEIVDRLSLFVEPIRELLRWFRCKDDKNEEFRRLCKEKGLCVRSLCFDFSKGWRMTVDNFRMTYKYREVLSKLYNDGVNHSPLEDSQWDAVNALINLASKFDDVAGRFPSMGNNVGSHLVIQDCVVIAHHLKTCEKSYESDPRLCSVVGNIRSKWLELFPDIPTIHCVATILDPHIKLEGLRKMLAYYYETLGVDYDVDKKVAHRKDVLQQLHDHYLSTQEKPETNTSPSSEEGQNQNKSSSTLEFNVIRDVFKKKRKRDDDDDDQEKNDDSEKYFSYEFELDEEFNH